MSFVVFAGAPHCSEENAQMQEETFDYDEESVLVQAEIHAVREQYGVNNFRSAPNTAQPSTADNGFGSPASNNSSLGNHGALAKIAIRPSKKK